MPLLVPQVTARVKLRESEREREWEEWSEVPNARPWLTEPTEPL